MDLASIKIRELIYHYAISDRVETHFRFKTEARIRKDDYASSPVLSLVRMVRRLCQKRKCAGKQKNRHYPDPYRSLVQSSFNILPRKKKLQVKSITKKAVVLTIRPQHFAETYLTDDTLIQFNFKSKLNVHEIIYEITARNRTAEKPFFVFYCPLIQHDH